MGELSSALNSLEGCKAVRRLFMLLVVVAGLAGGAALWWLNQSLPMRADTVDLSVEPGTLPRAVAQARFGQTRRVRVRGRPPGPLGARPRGLVARLLVLRLEQRNDPGSEH